MTGMKKSKRLSLLLCLIMMISVLFAGQAAYAADGYNTLTINKEVAGNAEEKESKYKFTVVFYKNIWGTIRWDEALKSGQSYEVLCNYQWTADGTTYEYVGAGEWAVIDKDGYPVGTESCPPDHATAGWPNRVPYDLPADVLPAGVTKAGGKAGTYTFELSDSGSMVFSNIPADYKYYEISEDDNSSICNTYVDGTRGRAASGNLTADKTHTFSNRMLRSVKYDGNGAGNPDVMSDKGYSGEYRSDLKAEKNLYTREEKVIEKVIENKKVKETTKYIFDGWNTAKDGKGTPYEEGAALDNAEASITLYAQWSEEVSIEPLDDPDGSSVQSAFSKPGTKNGGTTAKNGGTTAKTVGVNTGDMPQNIPLAAFTAIAVLFMLLALLRKTKVSDR